MKILVVDVPALHVGYLGCYGNDWVATPNIDRLACEGIVFDRHFYDVAQPVPAEWTGHHPFPLPEQPPFPASPTLGEILRRHDVPCAFQDAPAALSIDNLQQAVCATLAASRHTFAWARFPSLVPPWNLPGDLLDSYCEEEDVPWPDPPLGVLENPDDLLRLQSTYAAVVTHVDAHLGALLDVLREERRLDDVALCLTSTSALPLAEHGIVGLTRPWTHEEFVHLPLLVRLPGGEFAGLRLDTLTQVVDLLPTFLGLLDITPPPCHGRDLGPLIRGGMQDVRPFAVSGLRDGAAVEWSLRTREWAFLMPVSQGGAEAVRTARLYVKPDDRWEVNDVRQHHIEWADTLEKALRETAQMTQQPGDLAALHLDTSS